MRRASVLVAVTAVSLIIVSACTSFPDLSVDEATDDGDAASSSNGDAAGNPQGGDDDASGGQDASGTKQDASAGKDSSTGSDAASGTKDAAPGVDAGQPDSAPDPCAASTIDCSVTANKVCKPCVDECANGCTDFLERCCAIENGSGNSGTYKSCCYFPGASCTNNCT